MTVELHCGDMIDVCDELEADSIDTCITDPPYGLDFMGKDWDHGVPGVRFWKSVLRVVKPGGVLLAFGGSRTHHRLMVAIEDAGWDLKDCLIWLYAGQNMPKSHNISKAMDKAGMEISDLWDGWGTALKPCWEPIVLAMKPLDGTYVKNAEKWGVAGINIDGCRIELNGETPSSGRWPANVILDEEAGRMLDAENKSWAPETSLEANHDASEGSPRVTGFSKYPALRKRGVHFGDGGGPSRFYYCAKASRSERDAGMEEGEVNDHPTVKPLELMRWLCKLTSTPTGGSILDPFMGSGTTGIAAVYEDRDFIGIDNKQHYVDIATRRIGMAELQHKIEDS